MPSSVARTHSRMQARKNACMLMLPAVRGRQNPCTPDHTHRELTGTRGCSAASGCPAPVSSAVSAAWWPRNAAWCSGVEPWLSSSHASEPGCGERGGVGGVGSVGRVGQGV
eukprot:248643-Chlamydomonas_euryale.AAC.1